ncbi:MAG: hypothetical protein IPJ65_10845 [Archangiaceae bacterium]|nr:hypothetical protein [Archangiaceae bacterium]
MSQPVNRRFEGRARLDTLLERAGSLADAESVAEAFLKAQKDDVPASVVISALFEDEPRFSDRDDAPALYGNLFGLWDLLLSGERVDLKAPPEKAGRPKKPRPPPPPPKFPKEGPTAEWLDGAFGYLESCLPAERTRLEHAFDNRGDALITWLDEAGASDQVYSAARQILFELFAVLELGAPHELGRVTMTQAKVEVPAALSAWAHEAVFQAATDEDEPLDAGQSQELGERVETGLQSLWNGVIHGGQRPRR